VAGCGDEAWEIIAEFAAAEALVERASSKRPHSDVALGPSFALAAEALLDCLDREQDSDCDDYEALDMLGVSSTILGNN